MRHGSVMERCHGSDASRKRHGKVSWKWCVMEASWKGVMEVMRHGKRHGKCVMEVMRHGSVMEKV